MNARIGKIARLRHQTGFDQFGAPNDNRSVPAIADDTDGNRCSALGCSAAMGPAAHS